VHELVGIVPAGGRATRISPLPCSKEILPVGVQRIERQGREIAQPKVASHHLLERMRFAGAANAYVILADGKWDIPAYFGDGAMLDMELAYLVIRDSPGTPYTVDRAFSFVSDKVVLFGFPDLLFDPEDAFLRLLERQADTGAAVVLGLFRARSPETLDMVATDATGKVVEIVIKPAHTPLTHAWIIAVWTPEFTRFLHDHLPTSPPSARELFIGDVLLAALDAGVQAHSVSFSDGAYRDIGNPEELLSTSEQLD
jgi:glucose-1-phosphate thymidylyltransferase